jgi:hypothetical protein
MLTQEQCNNCVEVSDEPISATKIIWAFCKRMSRMIKHDVTCMIFSANDNPAHGKSRNKQKKSLYVLAL